MSTAAKLRQIALEQPNAEKVETWGHPTFRIGCCRYRRTRDG
jgi:hypothetical protein